MAEELESFTFHNGRPYQYPWADWLNGKAWKLKHGVDFRVEILSFRSTISRAAKRMGGRAKTQCLSEKELVIQFIK